MTPSPSTLPRAWLVVGVLWVVAALNYLDRNVITTMHDSVVAAIPMTEAQYGWLTTAFLIVYGLFSPLGGYLADRFDRRKLIISSLFIWSLFTWLTGHATTFTELVILRALMGLSEAAYIPAALALIADYHRGPTRSLANGIHLTGFSVGSILGGLGGKMAETYYWGFAFDVFGLFGIAYSVVLFFTLREAPREEIEVGPGELPESQRPGLIDGLKALFTNRSFLLLFAFWGLLGPVGWVITTWLPVYFKETFALTQGNAGIWATWPLFFAALIGKVAGGTWADFWSRTNQRGRIFVAAIGMGVAAVAFGFVSTTHIFVVAIVGLSLYGFTRTFADTNLMPVLCQVSDPRYRATGYGLLNMFNVLMAGMAVQLGGHMRDAKINIGLLFQGIAVALIVCGALLLCIRLRSAHGGAKA